MPGHFLVETDDKDDGYKDKDDGYKDKDDPYDKDDGFIDDGQGQNSRKHFKNVRFGKI